MKLFSKLSALGAVLAMTAAFASPASATVFGSNDGDTRYVGFLPGTGAFPNLTASLLTFDTVTFNLSSSGIGTTWVSPLAGSQWVGPTTLSGPGSGNVNPPQGYYVYTYTFATAGTLSSLLVYADDTASVWLGATPGTATKVITADALGSDTHCSDGTPSCIFPKFGSIAPNTYSVTAGEKLYFIVQQKGNADAAPGANPSGLDFAGVLDTGAVPEPSSLLLLGSGLIGSAGMMMRRMRASRS
jgi:hypothetical protein